MANLNPAIGSKRTGRYGKSSLTNGLTLIELLGVMVVLVILAALLMPGVQGMMSSSNLKGGANLVLAQMDLARQTAVTRNLQVDLRFYQDTTRSKDANGNFPFRIIAIVIPASASGTGSDQFVTPPLNLPGDVIIDSSVQYSTLLNTRLGTVGLQPIAATELSSAPLSVRGLPYVQCVFLATGAVNLDPSQQWCATFLNGNLAKTTTPNMPSADFVTIILDPQTSHAREYQP